MTTGRTRYDTAITSRCVNMGALHNQRRRRRHQLCGIRTLCVPTLALPEAAFENNVSAKVPVEIASHTCLWTGSNGHALICTNVCPKKSQRRMVTCQRQLSCSMYETVADPSEMPMCWRATVNAFNVSPISTAISFVHCVYPILLLPLTNDAKVYLLRTTAHPALVLPHTHTVVGSGSGVLLQRFQLP